MLYQTCTCTCTYDIVQTYYMYMHVFVHVHVCTCSCTCMYMFMYMMLCLFYIVEDNNTRVLFEKALSNIHSDQARYVSLYDTVCVLIHFMFYL